MTKQARACRHEIELALWCVMTLRRLDLILLAMRQSTTCPAISHLYSKGNTVDFISTVDPELVPGIDLFPAEPAVIAENPAAAREIERQMVQAAFATRTLTTLSG